MTSEQTAEDTGRVSAEPATFRPVPLVALVAVGFVAIGLSPIAFQGGAWFLLFLAPLALAWWLVRTRTLVDATSLRVLLVRGSRRVPWDDVATLRVADRGWVRAVRGDDSELALVGVRPRDLGRLALASDGRIDMPTPDEIAAAREHQRELEATRMRIARLRERQSEAGAENETGDDVTGDEAGGPDAPSHGSPSDDTLNDDTLNDDTLSDDATGAASDRSTDTDTGRQRRHFADTPSEDGGDRA